MEERTTEQIRSLIDTTRDALECIESLGVSTDEWSPFIVFIMQSKMDDVTKHEYEKYLGGATELPKYKLMKVFLEREFRVIDSSNVSINTRNIGENVNLNAIPPPTPPRSFNDNKYKNQANQNAGSANQAKQQSYSVEKCPLCSENHWLLNCQQFIDRTPIQRKEFAESKNICIKCLHAHEKDQCKSKYQCKICKGPHSVKLHTVYDDVPQSSTTVAAIQETNSVFATALVNVHDKFGAKHLLRVFIDMGSGGAFVSERAAQLLCLPRKREIKDLTGLDGAPLGKSTNSVRLQVESLHDDSFKLAIDSNVMRSIICPRKFPEQIVQNMRHITDIELADPEFANPSQIDLLFGVDIYGLIIKDGIRKGLTHEPIAQNSHLGWLVLGGQSNTESFGVQINSVLIESQLQKLWENEKISMKPTMSEENAKCVEHFEGTHERCRRQLHGCATV